MNCSDICRLLAEGRTPGKEALSHIGQCSHCGALAGRIRVTDEKPDPASLQRYKDLVGSKLSRVRPMATDRQLTFIFVVLFLCFAVFATVPVGFFGLRALSVGQMVVYFAVLIIGALFMASTVVQEMAPGSRRYLNPGTTMLIELIAVVLTVLILFHSFRVTRSFLLGRQCLILGSECAAVSSILFALVLKDGWFVSPVRAGAVTGFLAGLTGVAVLGMHCALLTSPHILVWHVSVLPLGMLGGALVGFAIQKFRLLRNF